VAERPNAGALKAPEGKLSGGSNPSLAAFMWRGIWEEVGCKPNSTAPSLAAFMWRGIWEEVGCKPNSTAPSLAAFMYWSTVLDAG
jgi:hypothetical protein